MTQSETDRIIDQIIGGFKIYVISLVLVYAAILIADSLTGGKFIISKDSAWFTSFVGAAFITLVAFIKKKNKQFFS